MIGYLDEKGMNALFDALQRQGLTWIGPTVRDGALVYDHLPSLRSLPIGWKDEQDAGTYKLRPHEKKDAWFGYNVGPHSWKKYLLPSRQKMWEAHQDKGQITFEGPKDTSEGLVFLGLRSCEIHAIAIQDKILLGRPNSLTPTASVVAAVPPPPSEAPAPFASQTKDAAGLHFHPAPAPAFVDPHYLAQRDKLFLIAVQCGQAAKTCFCASMGTGPRADKGFDLALTEIWEGGQHGFVVESGSDKGEATLACLPLREARPEEIQAALGATSNAAAEMTRSLPTEGIKDLLYDNGDHPHWKAVADRCLSCANCTMVCPTCFCTTTEDITDLRGDHTERWRLWDSCFHSDFSYIHGGVIRPSVAGRYRHWITHKLATWIDQTGTSGCVGCGRCIAWCPAGIDITAEIQALRASSPSLRKQAAKPS